MLRKVISVTFALMAVLAWTQPVDAGELKLTIHDGKVTLFARDVPLRQILAEWARVGQTNVVNAEKIGGPPLTLQLDDVPEKVALDIILRSTTGYLVAPRMTMIPGASQYDRILLMTATASTIVPRPGPGTTTPLGPPQQRPAFVPAPAPGPGSMDQAEEPEEQETEEPEETEETDVSEGAAVPLVRPGMMGPNQPNGANAPQTAPVPGVMIAPPQPQVPIQFRNPYGVPAPVPQPSAPQPPATQPPPRQP